jgi:hypothetical protein
MPAEPLLRANVVPIRRRGDIITIWYKDDDGFHHHNNGRFHHRRNLPHIARCINLIRQRNAQAEEVRVDD